ncbi:uncharacterized protein [Epargyreus clarus]|uniref:uncharacterized protein isoform X2 n=1 Tax=Epargyreus clarus TaxID=520877 RepID=UPI003C3085F9
MFLRLICLLMCWGAAGLSRGKVTFYLYRPRDISEPRAMSRFQRYDLSFGMGTSDTITLVFRTIYELDYECTVEIVVDSDTAFLLIVVRYPTLMGLNCEMNRDAITVLKKNVCLRLCDFVQDELASYIIFPVQSRLRFKFVSNSSINSDMNAYLYQVTATTARQRPPTGCFKPNETTCTVNHRHYCFTSGVVCDGIRNCGVNDWFDERKALCGLPIEKLDVAPVVAVAAALLCALLAASHVLLRCLPPQGKSFFIFNANEDNRLCIDPLLKPRGSYSPEPEKKRHMSLIPVLSSSSESEIECNSLNECVRIPKPSKVDERAPRRKMTMRSMTAKIQEKFRLVTGSRNLSTSLPAGRLPTTSMDV